MAASFRSRNPLQIYILCFLSCFCASRVMCQETARPQYMNVSSTQVSYDLDTAFIYLDEFHGLSLSSRSDTQPLTSRQLQEPKDETTSEHTYRTVGVRHMKLGVEWVTPKRLKAFILLRPDAVNGKGLSQKEVDTRSGYKISLEDDVQLLDLYELSLLREGISFSAGVRSHVVREYKAYSDILGFGFEAREPRKAFGAYLDMPKLATVLNEGAVDINLAALNGTSDRHTERNVNEVTSDESPATKTPYWGGVVSSQLVIGKMSVGISTSMIERKLVDGKATQNFYGAGAKAEYLLLTIPMISGIEARQMKKTYKTTSLNLAPISTTSLALTQSTEILPGRMFVLGVKAGNMARQASDDLARALQTRGYQVEAGLKAWLGEGMEASGILTREWCRGQTEGSDEQRGCFGESDNKKSTISRFALQIAYRTGGSL